MDDGGGEDEDGEDEDGEERRDKLSAKARQISQRCQRLSSSRLIHPAWLLHSLSVWPPSHLYDTRSLFIAAPIHYPCHPHPSTSCPKAPRSPAACHSPYRRSRLTGRSCVVKRQPGQKGTEKKKRKKKRGAVRQSGCPSSVTQAEGGFWSGET